MDDPENQQTALFLWKTAQSLSTTCPAASRYYVSTLSRHVGNSLVAQSKSYRYCKYCGCLWSYLNHKIRIQPIPPPNCHIKKLLKWEKEQPWKLNNRQKKKLKKYRESTNKITYTCNVCKKTTPFVGLKKYSAKEQEMLISIPAPKIKLKKGDLNAGLFLRTPTEKKIQNESETNIQDNKCQNEVPFQASPTPELMDPSNPNNKPQTTHFTSEIMKKNVTPQITSSSKKKKRKGLLAQILNQEQEAKRQKKTLSSFLTSL
ncbi:hypothetical protein AVEN_74980-1 [Araneus ventricosus]|uniref:Uncharacterized protein n=1 Tax=Araneus ventricosus TaxID=182803 RepID=A0A4Y2FVS6_ARAVE|nr:hypothetical protein AVEN_74980-1 [Araneus ventricosus]